MAVASDTGEVAGGSSPTAQKPGQSPDLASRAD